MATAAANAITAQFSFAYSSIATASPEMCAGSKKSIHTFSGPRNLGRRRWTPAPIVSSSNSKVYVVANATRGLEPGLLKAENGMTY